MNPFETLPDDAMLHIFSFLPGTDLLTLSTVDKKFNRVITTSKETKDKTPMVIDFRRRGLKLLDAIKAAQSRGFTALKLSGVTKYKSKTLLFNKMMKQLSGTVQDLVIESSNFEEDQFQSIIEMFLPKLLKCNLGHVFIGENEQTVEVSTHSGSNHPLKVLEIINTEDIVLNLFADCNDINSFKYHDYGSENNKRLNDFLALQTRLEKLSCNYDRLDLGRMNFNQLKVLKTWFEDNAKAAELGKLQSLKILKVTASPANLRRVIESICSAAQLEELHIQATRNGGESQHLQLEGILNHNVRKLTIYGRMNVTAQLLDVFNGVESICFHLESRFVPLDLSYVPMETIKKIKIKFSSDIEGLEDFPLLRFSPEQVPFNFALFESNVYNFVSNNAEGIESITIGHENWRYEKDFSLPNLFCEGLVKSLPKLKYLELFNVAHRGRFIRFLEANQRKLVVAKLIKPFPAGEPEPKKFKIEI